MSKYFATLKKCAKYGLLIGIVALAPLGAERASAVSSYDSAYVTTDNLTVKNPTYCPDGIDISTNWTQYILDETKHPDYGTNYDEIFGQAKNSFQQALNSGTWGVSRWGTDTKTVQIFWTTDSSLQLSWDTNGVLAGTVYYVTLECSPGGNLNTNGVYLSAGSMSESFLNAPVNNVWISLPSADIYNFFVYTDYFNYPTGYEGLPVRETYEPAPPTPDLSNDASISYEVQGKNIKYWNTTPEPPLDPVLMTCEWTAVNDDEGILLDKIAPCNEMQSVTVTTLSREEEGIPVNNLLIIMRILYDVNGDGLILPGESIAEVQETLKIDGTTYTGNTGSNWENDTRVDWYACFSDELPYIHPFNCIGNFEVMADALKNKNMGLGTWNVKTQSETQQDCRSLTSVGEWLKLENNTVCAQIPSTMRTIVTSFIIVALSLLGMKWVLNRSADI